MKWPEWKCEGKGKGIHVVSPDYTDKIGGIYIKITDLQIIEREVSVFWLVNYILRIISAIVGERSTWVEESLQLHDVDYLINKL